MNKTTDLLHLHLALVKPLKWMDPSLNVVTIPPKVKENHFRHCYAKLLKTTKKHVNENIKDKKKRLPTVACTTIKFTTHFFLVSYCEEKRTMKDFVITWFIDCSHRDENVTMVTKLINDSYWFMYDDDCISAEMEERSLINMGPHYGSLVINIPMQHECKKIP